MKPLSLQNRVVVALMASVVVTVALMYLLSFQWVRGSFDDWLRRTMMYTISEDMDRVIDAVALHPEAGTRLDLGIGGGGHSIDLTVTRVLIPVSSRTGPVDVRSADQWISVSTTDLVADHPACLQPAQWDRHAGPHLSYALGSWVGWTEECDGMMMAYGFTPADAASGLDGWLIVHAHTSSEETHVPWGLIAAVAGLLLITWVLGVLLADRIVSPVARTREMAEAVASGDLNARAPVVGRDELAQLATAINAMADQLTDQIGQLERSNEAQRQFVADVAHELRTPTAALLASAEALTNQATRDAAAAQVAPQLRRLAGLTEDLLTISQMDAGRAAVVFDRVDLVDLTREVIAEVVASPVSAGPQTPAGSNEDGVTTAGQTVAREQVVLTAPAEFTLDTDPTRLRVILRNLLANAQQHGAPPVSVTIAADGADTVITVRDAGDGVPVPLADRIFDRFVRGDAARQGDSTGLGLAIASENARLLGGTLTLTPDRTTFTLRFPGSPG